MINKHEELLQMIKEYVLRILSEDNYKNPIQVLQFWGLNDEILILNYDCDLESYYVIDFDKNNMGLTTLEDAIDQFQQYKNRYIRYYCKGGRNEQLSY